jgi:hypothetical protein
MARLPRKTVGFRVFVLLAGLLAGIGCDASGLWALLPTPLPTPAAFFPIATLPVSGFAGLFQSVGPAPIGTPLLLGNVEVTASDFIRPADHIVKRADGYPTLDSGEQFALVEVAVACHTPSGESCNVTELNFSMSGASGTTYYPVFTMFLTGLRGLFEGGQIPGGETWSGGLVFVLDSDETDLVLAYGQAPGMVGGQATFSLGD